MSRTRLLFEKLGRARYISHLDLMRTMQRVFIRAEVRLRHTEGFNPHPYMSFALPLPVGCESVCELMDFDTADDHTPLLDIPGLINGYAPEGIAAARCYTPARGFSDIKWLEVSGALAYDNGVPKNAARELTDFFSRERIMIPKKSKRGITEIDLIPLIRSLKITDELSDRLLISVRLSAQDPALNPNYLTDAIRRELAGASPDFALFRREAVFDAAMQTFE